MDTNTIAMIILFATFMIFMVLRVPVTFSMLGACVLTALYLGPKYVSSVFLRLGDGVQSFSFLAIPFFIFAGDIMAEGGISDRLVEVANVMVGRFRGGLAYVNVIASTFFGGISGSPTADVSSLGPIEIGMMTKSGYDKDFSVATTVATATQALIIPPSHNMIIYGMAAGGLSTGKLFLAGIGPGLMLCAAMCILVARITKQRGYPRGSKYTVRESLKIISDGFLGVMTIAPLILIVTPILLPVVKALGMDPIHFGIVIMMNLAVGSLTPPVGTTLFAGCAVGDIPIEKATKALLPYYAVMVVALLLVTYIPAFSMTLPNLLMH